MMNILMAVLFMPATAFSRDKACRLRELTMTSPGQTVSEGRIDAPMSFAKVGGLEIRAEEYSRFPSENFEQWEGPITIKHVESGKECRIGAQPGRFYLDENNEHLVVPGRGEAPDYETFEVYKVGDCGLVAKVETYGDWYLDLSSGTVSAEGGCECAGADSDCDCYAAQVYRFAADCKPSFLEKESGALTKERLGTGFFKGRKKFKSVPRGAVGAGRKPG